MNRNEIIGELDGSTVTRAEISLSSNINLSLWSRLALLAALAGYRRGSEVVVEEENLGPARLNELAGRFLSFLLSYPPADPPFELSVKAPAEIAAPKPRDMGTVVLVSGGIDSTAGLLWCLQRGLRPTGCWLDYGQPYRAAEESAVKQITERLGVPLHIVRIDLAGEMEASSADWGYIIPARNFLLCCIAADAVSEGTKGSGSSGSRILLCAHDEELYVPDKSVLFFRLASRYLGAEVWSPFLTANKTDILAYWKREWAGPFGITPSETITCYDHSGRCGRCKACLKRAVAISASGWEHDELRQDPFADPSGLITDYYWPKLGSYPPRRQQDLLIALGAHMDQLPASVRGEVRAMVHARHAELGLRRAELAEVNLLNGWA